LGARWPGQKSITRLECEEAVKQGKEVLAFLIDQNFDWPIHLKESYRITEALEKGSFDPNLVAEVQRNLASLVEFRQWLNSRAIRATFTNPDDLRGKVESALRDWWRQHPEFTDAPSPPRPVRSDPTTYLKYLREQTAWIDIRGLQVGAGKAYRFPIEDLYIPLTTPGGAPGKPLDLRGALLDRRLVIVGDPGSGKTTFLRHVAHEGCCGLLDAPGDASLLFPIFIRISDLADHIRNCQAKRGRPTTQAAPSWLLHFLAAQSEELNWGLDEAFFREKLQSNKRERLSSDKKDQSDPCIVLLDGLDEAPNQQERETIVRLFEAAIQAYNNCRFVVSTRPLAFTGLAGFHTAQIEPLEPTAIEKFLEHWCGGLFPEDVAGARRHFNELSEALHRTEIRRMAATP
jgi:hypothetical protein